MEFWDGSGKKKERGCCQLSSYEKGREERKWGGMKGKARKMNRGRGGWEKEAVEEEKEEAGDEEEKEQEQWRRIQWIEVFHLRCLYLLN